MAGSVDLIQRGQTALEFTDDTLSISPCLPEEMQGLHLRFLYRGYWLHLDVELRPGDGLRPAWLGRPAADPGSRRGPRLRARRAPHLHLPSRGGLAAAIRSAGAREGGSGRRGVRLCRRHGSWTMKIVVFEVEPREGSECSGRWRAVTTCSWSRSRCCSRTPTGTAMQRSYRLSSIRSSTGRYSRSCRRSG